MNTYIKKPVSIKAIQWDGNNKTEVDKFLDGNGYVKGEYVDIGTIEGPVVASVGDMVVQGVAGEFYPCRHDIFKKTHYTQDEWAEISG